MTKYSINYIINAKKRSVNIAILESKIATNFLMKKY